MKKALLIIFGVPVAYLITSSVMVYAELGTEGLEAYNLALQSTVATAQYAMENIVDVVKMTGQIIVELFEVAIEA